MLRGCLGAMVLFHTRTESFSNCGVRNVDLGGCGVAELLRPDARTTSQRVFRMGIGSPSPRMVLRRPRGRDSLRGRYAKSLRCPARVRRSSMREELSRRDLCLRLMAGGLATG